MKILNVKTENVGPFKLFIEVLKEILAETNIEFKPKSINKKGIEEDSCMKIVDIDSSKTLLIHLKLLGSYFETFECKQRLIIGINLANFYKLIKPMDKEEILELFINSNDQNTLNIKMDRENLGKKTIQKFKLLELQKDSNPIPRIKFDVKIQMNSSEFMKICREMNNIADYVQIRCSEKSLVFSCEGEYANRKTQFIGITQNDLKKDDIDKNSCNNNVYIKFNEDYKDKVIKGIFELKHLVLFSKCSQLCDSVYIYMKKDDPIIINYRIPSLGEIHLLIAPTNLENDCCNNEDDDYSDEEFEDDPVAEDQGYVSTEDNDSEEEIEEKVKSINKEKKKEKKPEKPEKKTPSNNKKTNNKKNK